MVEDKLLIWKFRRGNTDALGRIYVKYKNELLKLAVCLVKDVNIAEDAVQDVFVKFAQSPEKVGIRGNLKNFLSVCVLNQVRNRRRSIGRRCEYGIEQAQDVTDVASEPHQWAVLSEQMKLVSNAMTQLPDEQREVVALYIQGDMTLRRIAELQDASISTVQGRYRYGIAKLRKLLNGEV
jgi:RNA polymerase sigma-70 factor (ECF subfamily)